MAVVLKNQNEEGEPLEVTYLPEMGMNFISLKKGSLEVIDQSTRPLFEERFAGLGPLIGPHFHHRKIIPPIKDESLFPHIARVRAKGTKEPFSHGIGRYAPWEVVEQTGEKLRAHLNGDMTWEGVALQELEGQNFVMEYDAHLRRDGLAISLSVRSDTDSVVGLHTYYALVGGKGTVKARVAPQYNDQGTLKPIPSTWNYDAEHFLNYDFPEPTDYGFTPFPDPLNAEIFLETGDYGVKVAYNSSNEENAWQLWHPEGASFACIEPLSAKDPRKPHLSVSQLDILITITT